MRFLIIPAVIGALLLPATEAFAANPALSIEANQAYLAANARKPGVRVMRDGLQYQVLQAGNGTSPHDGDIATVNYTLWMIDGTKMEGTEPDFPSQFPIDSLIPGWREALKAMRVGDHWKLVIPSELAYGPRGNPNGGIPPNQALVFEVELLKIFTPPPKKKKDDDQQGGGGGGPGQ